MVCASPHFQFVTVAGGLFRTVSHSRFSSSYSAQWLIATALHIKSSQVVVRTALPSFPSVTPTQCNPVCGPGRIQLFRVCAFLVSLQCRGRIAGHTTAQALACSTTRRPITSATCGTTAFPSPLSLSTREGTPLATRPTSGSISHHFLLTFAASLVA